MKLYCCGFNLYGQFTCSKDLVIKSFTEFTYEYLTDIYLSHSYAFIISGSDVYIHGAGNNKTHETKKLAEICGHNLISLSCFDNQILYLDKSGTVFKIDLNKSYEAEITPNFLKVENSADDEDCIVKIVCGANINIQVSKKGKLFHGPNKLEFENEHIMQAVAGREHCLLLDRFGNVYSIGIGSRGQLGHGSLTNELEPRLVEALGGIKITKIAVGGWHSCALSESGDLYIWGWNGNGQLGLGSNTSADSATSVMASPQIVDFENCDNANAVACGTRHTIVLLDNSKLYGMGWNKYKQLGNIDRENVYKPTLLHEFLDEDVLGLKCGPWSSVVLIH